MSLRAELAARDGWVCNGCGCALRPDGENGDEPPATVDHKLPPSRGGTSDPDNLWLMCAACNSSKSDLTIDEWEHTLDFDGGFMRRGFTAVPNGLLEDTSVSVGARMTLIALMSFAWNRDPFPGQGRLASMLGCTDRTIREYLRELVSAGYLKVYRRGRGRTNVYRIAQAKILRTTTDHAPEDSSGRQDQDRKPASGLDRKPASGPMKEDEEEEDEGTPTGPAEETSAGASTAAAKPRARKRDPLWDALDETIGTVTTRSERGRRNRALAELREANVDDTELRRLIRVYRQQWPNVAVTETAIAANLSQLRRHTNAGRTLTVVQPPCDACGVGAGQHTTDCPNATPTAAADTDQEHDMRHHLEHLGRTLGIARLDGAA